MIPSGAHMPRNGQARARDGASPGGREYHAAICNSCGGQAMVPFAPRNDRPVYCSTCFDRVRAGPAARPDATQLDGRPGARSHGGLLLGPVVSHQEECSGRDHRSRDGRDEPESWSDAARQAVATASKTVRNIRTIEVVKSTARIEDGEIVEYQVELKIGFEYEG